MHVVFSDGSVGHASIITIDNLEYRDVSSTYFKHSVSGVPDDKLFMGVSVRNKADEFIGFVFSDAYFTRLMHRDQRIHRIPRLVMKEHIDLLSSAQELWAVLNSWEIRGDGNKERAIEFLVGDGFRLGGFVRRPWVDKRRRNPPRAAKRRRI